MADERIFDYWEPESRLSAIRGEIRWIFQHYIEGGPGRALFFPRFHAKKEKIVWEFLFDDESRALVSRFALLTKEELRNMSAAVKSPAMNEGDQ
jgi:hypothetical protein